MKHALVSLLPPVLVVCMSCTSPPSGGPHDTPSTCFGVEVSFSGRLSKEQEAHVPVALRGAFYIESVQDITAAALERVAAAKEQVGEEVHGGVRYVALRDYRCVDFDGGVSGQMMVIERYRIKQ